MDTIESFTKKLQTFKSDIRILRENIDRAWNQIKTLSLIDKCEEDIAICFTQLDLIRKSWSPNAAFVDRKWFVSARMTTIEQNLDTKRRVINWIKPS